MKKLIQMASCLLLASASAGTMAQEAGSMMAKIGYAYFDPAVTSGNLSAPALPHTQINVGAAGTEIISGTYFFTDNVSTEIYAGIPPKHELYGAGAINGVGVLGTVKQMPVNVFAQYHFFKSTEAFRPYVGLAATFVHFADAHGSAVLTAITNPGGAPTTLSVKNAWGYTPQIGFTAWFNKQIFVDFSLHKSIISSKTTLSTGQTIEAKLNPIVPVFAVGYKF